MSGSVSPKLLLLLLLGVVSRAGAKKAQAAARALVRRERVGQRARAATRTHLASGGQGPG